MVATRETLAVVRSYFTFPFVCNPYSRFLSIYRHANRIAATRASCISGHPDRLGTPGEYARLVAELFDDTRALWGGRSSWRINSKYRSKG